MAKIDLDRIPEQQGSRYPTPFDVPCQERRVRRISDATGLTRLGVAHVRLPPGAWSSQRHFHTHEDEFVMVLQGEVVLCTDAGEEVLRAGDCVAFKAGVPDGHCAHNRSDSDAILLAVSNRDDGDGGEYPDIDLRAAAGRYGGKARFLRKDGTPYG